MDSSTDLHAAASKLTIAQWHDLLVARLTDPSIKLEGHEIPGAPAVELQMNLNGRAAAASMPAARDFLVWFDPIIKESPLYDNAAAYLDFGAGWGRIWRYFLYTFPKNRAFGLDVNPKLANVWKAINLGADIRIGEPYAPLPFEDGSISFATSNSVWSHLSEELALSTLAGMRRIMKPNGLFALTSFGVPHLKLWKRYRTLDAPTERQKMLSELSDDYDSVITRYADGEFIFLKTGLDRDGRFLRDYEIAAVPRQWFAGAVPGFELVEFTDDVLPQSLVLLRAV